MNDTMMMMMTMMIMIGHCRKIIRLIFARTTPSPIAHAQHLHYQWGIFIDDDHGQYDDDNVEDDDDDNDDDGDDDDDVGRPENPNFGQNMKH